jgi:hypothetical protein
VLAQIRTGARSLLIRVCIALFLGAALNTRGQHTNDFAFGIHSGFSSGKGVRAFYQEEAFGQWNLPVDWSLGTKNWFIEPRLEATAGYIFNDGSGGFVGTFGPTAIFGYRSFPVRIDFGCRPTVLAQDNFAGKEFGTAFQFTSHCGLEWDLSSRWYVDFRYQHMSNAGFSNSNSGLDTFMFGVGYEF